MTYQNIWNPAKSDCLQCSTVWGFQTEHAYSSFGRTRDRYACDFIFVLEVLRFLFKNPRLLFALATMLLACCVHFKSDWRVIPRYFAEETDSKATQNKTYHVLQDCSPYSCSSYNNINTYRPKNQTISSIYIQTSSCIQRFVQVLILSEHNHSLEFTTSNYSSMPNSQHV
jgi:hypothetical protein